MGVGKSMEIFFPILLFAKRKFFSSPSSNPPFFTLFLFLSFSLSLFLSHFFILSLLYSLSLSFYSFSLISLFSHFFVRLPSSIFLYHPFQTVLVFAIAAIVAVVASAANRFDSLCVS